MIFDSCWERQSWFSIMLRLLVDWPHYRTDPHARVRWATLIGFMEKGGEKENSKLGGQGSWGGYERSWDKYDQNMWRIKILFLSQYWQLLKNQ